MGQEGTGRLRCECRCGYTCGGPGECTEPDFRKCLAEHFKKDCDHVWDGPTVETDVMGCTGSSVTCSACGEVAMYHDMRNGP